MVTRKTRLLSAFAALLMLVSLFTCFCLPATAAVATQPSNLTAYKDRTASSTATDYAITDAEDWLRFVADSNGNADYGPLKSSTPQSFNGINLWMTADIDFQNVDLDVDDDGTVEIYEFCVSTDTTVIPSTATNKDDDYFYGNFYGQGHAIKNLVVDVSPTFKSGAQAFGLFTYTATAKIMDLTIDESCSFTVRNTVSGVEAYTGVFCGNSANNAWFVNCVNEASLDFYDEGSGKTNSISCFGRKQRGYMVNCINRGNLTNHDAGRVTVFAEWMNSTTTSRIVYLYNCINTGVLTSEDTITYVPGLVSTNSSTDTIVSQNQIRLYNTYAVGCHIGSHNSYTKIDALSGGTYFEDHGVEKTGELAFLMNKSYNTKYDSTYGRKYYTVKDQNIAYGTAAEQPIKLNFTFGNTNETLYAIADAEGKLNLATLYPINGAVYTPSAGTMDGNILTATPGSEINVTVTSTVLVYDYLQDAIDYYKARNVAFFQDVNGVVLTSDLINGMQDKIDNDGYVDQSAIDADLAVLNGYSFVESNTVPMTDYDLYGDAAVKFSVSSKEGMAKLLEVGADMSAETVIYVTANIDMEGSASNRVEGIVNFRGSIDGGNKIISNLHVNNALLLAYKGAYVKDITFENCSVLSNTASGAFLVDKVEEDLTLSNITLDGVKSETQYSTAGGMQGILVCQLSGAELTMEDITIINSEMIRPDGGNYWNSGIVLGKTYKGTLNVDGVYLNNNTITGARTASGTGIAFGEIICDATVKNVAVLNTTATDDYQNGIFSMVKEGYASTSPLAPVITIENVIAYNNGETVTGIGTNDTDGTTTIKNVYLDTENVVSNAEAKGLTVTDCVAGAATAITSGEAAWALNKALAGDKWTMANGLPDFGTEDNQTVQVALEMDGFETEYLYVNLNEENTIAHSVPGCTFSLKNAADSSVATLNGDKLTVTGLPTDLSVAITAVSGALYFDALDAKIAEIEVKADFYIDAAATKTVAADLAAIKGRRATDYAGFNQLKIQEDLELLESYVLTEVDAASKATLVAAKDELDAFGTNISYFAQADAMTDALNKINAALVDTEAADGLEAKAINATMTEAAEAYNAIGERTIATGKVVPLKLYELFNDYTNDWTVADETDWREGVENITTNARSDNMTITVIDDIDMTADGDDSAVLPLAYTKYFNGVLDGQGHVFKNLKIDVTATEGDKEQLWVGLVSSLGKPGVVKNLGIESGSITVSSGIAAAARVGTIVGYAGSGGMVQNCWNAASVTFKLLTGGEPDSYVGGVVGSAITWTTIDGCYNLGAVSSEGKHAGGINGWAQTGSSTATHGRVYNSFNYGTVTSAINPTYVGAVRIGGGHTNGVANTYAIGTRLAFVATPDESLSDSQKLTYNYNNESNSELPAEIYSTGELAWKLNKGWSEGYSNHTMTALGTTGANYPNFINYEEIQPYYTLEDNKTVFGTEANQTLRITVKYDGMEVYLYANADAADIALGTEGSYTVESGDAEIKAGNLLDITGTDDVVVVVEAPAHTHDIKYTNHEDGTHTAYCDFSVTVDGRTFACDYEEETVACSEFTYVVDPASVNAAHAHQSVATCEDCGYDKTVDCDAGFNEAVTNNPGCESEGEKTFTCKNNCGYYYTEDIDATGHNKVYAPAGNNQHTITCTKCTTYSDVDDCTPDENGWQETFAPSVDAVGTKETTCTVCGGTVTADIPKLATVTVETALNAEETEVTATVGLKNNTGVATVTVEVAFDYTVMDLKEVTALNGLTVGTPAVEDGVVTFTVTSATEFTDDTADIATVIFTMKTESGNLVAANKDYELNVTAEAKNGADAPVALEADAATFTITKGNAMVKGDLTGDAEVNLADAVLLLRYVTGDELPAAYQGLITDDMADLTDEGDGEDLGNGQTVPEVNTNDVIYLLRYLNGWINAL